MFTRVSLFPREPLLLRTSGVSLLSFHWATNLTPITGQLTTIRTFTQIHTSLTHSDIWTTNSPRRGPPLDLAAVYALVLGWPRRPCSSKSPRCWRYSSLNGFGIQMVTKSYHPRFGRREQSGSSWCRLLTQGTDHLSPFPAVIPETSRATSSHDQLRLSN